MNELKNKAISLIGIGDDGCSGLTSRAVNAMSRCQVLAGGERQISFFPDFKGTIVPLKNNILESISQIIRFADEENVAVLASGDPLFFGIGNLLIEKAGCENVEIIPHVSSLQTAFAKIGMKWDDASWISLHGRKNTSFCATLHHLRKAFILTDTEMTPAVIAERLIEYSQTDWKGWLCENLDGPGERIREFQTPSELISFKDISPLNVLVLERNDPEWRTPPVCIHHSEDEYAKRMPSKGLITKKEIRIQSIAAMKLKETSIVWDIGAGSGSVSVECALISHRGRVYAVEKNSESILHCRENIRKFSADNVEIIEGNAPDVLIEIKDNPDAVFIGGSGGGLNKILKICYERLSEGGMLVANAITMENVHEIYGFARSIDAETEMIQMQISRLSPLASYMRYEAQNPIHIFAIGKGKHKSML